MSIAINMLAVLLSNGVTRGLGFASLFMTRRLLGPTLTGSWNLIQLFLGYGATVSSGAELGADRNIPYWHGKGEILTEEKTRNQMFSSALIESMLIGLVLLIASIYCRNHYRPEVSASLLWAAGYVVLTRMTGCFLIAFRTQNQFVLLGKTQMVLSLADFAITVSFVYFWRLQGQAIAFGLCLLIRILFFWMVIHRKSLFKIAWHFSWTTLRTLLPVGFPLAIYSFLIQSFLSMDSLIVAKRLGITALGYYSIAMSCSRAMAEIPTAFSSVVYPRLMEDFGANDNLELLGVHLYRNLKAAIFVLAPAVACILYFFLPFAIRAGVQSFIPAIPTVRLLILTGYVYSLTNISVQALIARNKSSWMLMLLAAIAALTAGTVWWISPFGIWWVGLTVLICHFLYFLALTLVVFSGTLGMKAALHRLGVLTAALAYLTGVLYGLDKLWPSAAAHLPLMTDLYLTTLKALLAFLCLGLLFWRADRHLRLIDRIKDLWPLPG